MTSFFRRHKKTSEQSGLCAGAAVFQTGARHIVSTGGAFFRCGVYAPAHPPRRKARQPQKVGSDSEPL